MFRPNALLAVVFTVAACAPTKPPRWVEGGSPLVIAPARWQRGDDDPIEIRANGQVLEGGSLRFVIDRVGRVADADYDPLAVLEPDGSLVGTDSQALGYVGNANAAPPGAAQAWLSVQPDGRVLYFSSEGDRSFGGVWSGCAGPQLRTCTLVTQLIAVRNYAAYPRSGLTVGVGLGIRF